MTERLVRVIPSTGDAATRDVLTRADSILRAVRT
jgi:hypothetical protein